MKGLGTCCMAGNEGGRHGHESHQAQNASVVSGARHVGDPSLCSVVGLL